MASAILRWNTCGNSKSAQSPRVNSVLFQRPCSDAIYRVVMQSTLNNRARQQPVALGYLPGWPETLALGSLD